MSLTRLTYYSLRNPSVSLEIPRLIETARRVNAPMIVTGILHYNGSAFLQVLEGHRVEVNSIYHRIAVDPRHTNITLIQCVDVNERMFPYWSMGLHEGMDEKSKSIFMRYFGSTIVYPETVGANDLLSVLQDLSADMKHELTVE